MSLRKSLFWAHLAVGCLAGMVILTMSFTGVLLTYERQTVRWADRDLRVSHAADDARRLPMDVLLQRVTREPGASPSSVTLRANPADPVEVSMGRNRVYLVDPYSGKLLGARAPRTRAFLQKVEDIHRWLGTPPDQRTWGRAVTGACNLGFLLLVISGPFLWIPRRWTRQTVRAIAWFRGGASARARDFNWHNTIGIWTAVPLLVIVASGVVMSYPWANNLVYKLTGSEIPSTGGRPNGGPAGRGNARGRQDQAAAISTDALWDRALRQVPGWQSVTLRLPASPGGPYAFTIDAGNGGRPDRRSQLTLNGNAEVVRWEPFLSFNTGRQVRGWLRFLHTGEAGGIAGQTIAGLASMGAVVLVWTGISLSVRRLWSWRRRRSSQALREEREIATVTR
jgi:uncharacterized iron-regulated membrane protein